MKILIVDDNHSFAAVIKEALEEAGFETISARDGLEGYSSYLQFQPDIIITDIQMPGVSGLAMMEHIRTHNPHVKTIYMSGDIAPYESSLREEQKKYQADFFEKPFSFDTLKKFLLAIVPKGMP